MAAVKPELACVYAALLMHDDGIAITSDKITTVLGAANVTVDAFWPSMFAKLLEKTKVDDIISAIGSGASAAPAAAAAPAAGGAAAPAEAAKAEEPAEEEEEEGADFDLFD